MVGMDGYIFYMLIFPTRCPSVLGASVLCKWIFKPNSKRVRRVCVFFSSISAKNKAEFKVNSIYIICHPGHSRGSRKCSQGLSSIGRLAFAWDHPAWMGLN